MNEFEIQVDKESEGIRLDTFLKNSFPDISRASIQKAIRGGSCKIDDKITIQPSAKIRTGQKITLDLEPVNNELEPVKEDVEILWQDKTLAICNKPAGISVHPCPSIKENTYIQQLLAHFPQLALQGGLRPGIVHRLDKNTSGLMLLALDEATRLKLSDAFSRRKIHKEYLALVYGVPPKTGECNEPIGRHPASKTKMAVLKKGGREASTSWERLWQFENNTSLLAVKIYTGRTHQIRVHLSHLGFPIIGDEVYGNRFSKPLASRQMLHAWKLDFEHPHTHEFMNFSVPPPQDFIQTALKAQNKMARIAITGNQGCGKTAFCTFLSQKGLPVISADKIVNDLYAPGEQAAEWLKFRFGDNMLDENGGVDKNLLFFIMENNPLERQEIEDTIHALVKQQIELFFQKNETNGQLAAVAEIPLFFECGWKNAFGKNLISVGINCPKELRWKRIENNRGWSEDKIVSIENWQWKENKKMSSCDYVVDNTKDIENLNIEAEKFFEWLNNNLESSRKDLRNRLDALWHK